MAVSCLLSSLTFPARIAGSKSRPSFSRFLAGSSHLPPVGTVQGLRLDALEPAAELSGILSYLNRRNDWLSPLAPVRPLFGTSTGGNSLFSRLRCLLLTTFSVKLVAGGERYRATEVLEQIFRTPLGALSNSSLSPRVSCLTVEADLYE